MILRVGKSGSLIPLLTSVTFWSQNTKRAQQRLRSRVEAVFAKAIPAGSTLPEKHDTASLSRPYVCKNTSRSRRDDRLALKQRMFTKRPLTWIDSSSGNSLKVAQRKKKWWSRRRWICERDPMRGRDSMQTGIEGSRQWVVWLLCDKLRTGPLHILSYMRGGSPTLKVPLLPTLRSQPVVITSFHICQHAPTPMFYVLVVHEIYIWLQPLRQSWLDIVVGVLMFTTKKFFEEKVPWISMTFTACLSHYGILLH